MKNFKIIIALVCLSLVLINCQKEDEQLVGLANEEIVQGLKEALKVGTDSATKRLTATNGYYKDQAVKLLLPAQVNQSITSFKSKTISVFGIGTLTGEDIYTKGIPGFVNPLSSKEDELILGINRAAESAAKDAGSIFFDAIVGMSISDGSNILFGGVDSAATIYLNANTRPQLFSKFEPKIGSALNTLKIGNKSVVQSYEDYVSDYNNILNTKVPTGIVQKKSIAELMGIQIVLATNLSEYSTNKGLDGLFVKIKGEERKIRKAPLHRVTDILKKIFGALD